MDFWRFGTCIERDREIERSVEDDKIVVERADKTMWMFEKTRNRNSEGSDWNNAKL